MSLPLRVLCTSLVMGLLAACGEDEREPTPPVAIAGADTEVLKGDVVFLDASASHDPGGAHVAFRWAQRSGTPVVLQQDGPFASFQAPHSAGPLVFEVEVRSARASATDAVSVTVLNRAPAARAGADLFVREGYVVTLDGRGSFDADGDALDHQWFQASGPAVTFLEGVPGTARFVAPTAPAVLGFSLLVTDGEASASDDVTITIRGPGQNLPPLAEAGGDLLVPRRGEVSLSGAGRDPDLDPVSFVWQQTAGPAVTLLHADRPDATFAAPGESCTLEFRLSVSDGMEVATDDLVVTVFNRAPQVVALTLAPLAPITTDDLVATLSAFDPDGDPLTTTWTWTKNGAVLEGVTGATLPADQSAKADALSVTATVSDGTDSVEATANVTIGDAPPVLTAAPPAEVAFGATFAFDVTGEDPDGDPLGQLAVHHGPAGLAVSGGHVSWPAVLPMFGPALEVGWGLSVAGAPDVVVLAGTVRVTDPGRAPPIRRAGLDIPASAAGLVAADLDGDGTHELLVGSARGVYELAHEAGGYAQRWMQPLGFTDTVGAYGGSAVALAAADVEGDAAAEVFVAAETSVVKLDGASRAERARVVLPEGLRCRELEAADLQGDGDAELVCLGAPAWGDDRKLVVLDAGDLSVRWETPAAALGGSLAIGNVDEDPALEIVTSGGYVFDGGSGANEWLYASGFGVVVDTGDLDGDGVEEIVGTPGWYTFHGYSAVLKAALWEHEAFDLDTLLVQDLDDDGVAEIVTGDGQWGDVTGWRYVKETNGLSRLFSLDSQDHGVPALVAADLDGDGATEIAWGSGWTSSGGDVFVVAEVGAALTLEWTAGQQLDSGFVGGLLARVAPGETALAFAVSSTNAGYDGSRLIRMDPSSGRYEVTDELGTNWSRGAALSVADHDGDGVDEVFLGTASYYDGYAVAYDLAAGVAEWTSPLGIGTVQAFAHGDLDGDPDLETAVLTTGGYVYAYDSVDQTLLWKSAGLGTGVDVAIADLDGDGAAEIVVATSGRVVAFRRAVAPFGFLEAASHTVASLDLAVSDVDGDGAPEVLVLAGSDWPSSGASLVRLDGALSVVSEATVPAGSRTMSLEELPGRRNVVLGVHGDSYAASAAPRFVAVDAVNGAEVWRSPPLVGTPARGSLSYLDWDGDGRPELAFAGTGGMVLTR